MCTEVPRDGSPAEYSCGKNGEPFSANYKANVYEAWQRWLQRDVVKRGQNNDNELKPKNRLAWKIRSESQSVEVVLMEDKSLC